MKRIVLYGFLLICFGAASYLTYINLADDPSSSALTDHIRNISTLQSKKTVYLYFSSYDEDMLVSEEHQLEFNPDPSIFGRNVIEALIRGPHSGLTPTIPPDSVVNAVFVTPDHTAYIDFSSSIRDNHPGGAQAELTTIYSIVNSLTLNIPEIHAVKLLIDGQESLTLCSHISLSIPFKTNILIIR